MPVLLGQAMASIRGIFPFAFFFFYFNRRQVFFNTELFELGWEAGVSESRAQHAFPHELLGLWVQDNPEKLC